MAQVLSSMMPGFDRNLFFVFTRPGKSWDVYDFFRLISWYKSARRGSSALVAFPTGQAKQTRSKLLSWRARQSGELDCDVLFSIAGKV